MSGIGACKGVRELEMGLRQVSGSEKGLGQPPVTQSVFMYQSLVMKRNWRMKVSGIGACKGVRESEMGLGQEYSP